MSYQVIARKYRPQRFRDVVGQEHVTRTLAQAIEQKRIAHAYLFCGPRGTGKTTVARIFAKCLNATNGPKVDFDDADPRAKEIAEGRSLDVLEIDGASNNSVDQVRDLRETCQYAPASSRFKIYIIDEVHMLSTAAFNALLKTLEEPPAHVKFLFATTDPEKVLPTILSRCQRFDLRRIPVALISQSLAKIAELEGVKITPAALHAIARGAEGAMRDAESTLDQLISFCGGQIEEGDVLSMFGLTAQTQIIELAGKILAGEVESSLRLLNELASHGKDLGRLLGDLLNHCRNLLIFQVSGGDLNLLEASEQEAAALAEQSQAANSGVFTRILEVLSDAEMRLRDAASRKILLEVAILRAIEARGAVSLDVVLQQLRDLRDGGTGGAAATPSGASAGSRTASPIRSLSASAEAMRETPVSAVAPGATPVVGGSAATLPSTGDLADLWTRLVEAAGRASPFTRSYLLEAHAVSFNKNLLVIGFDSQFEDHIALVDNARNHTLLQATLAEMGHANAQIKFVKADVPASAVKIAVPAEPASAAPSAKPAAPTASHPPGPARSAAPPREKPAPVPFDKDQFKNDPLIQKALEIFKGQIVEVRA